MQPVRRVVVRTVTAALLMAILVRVTTDLRYGEDTMDPETRWALPFPYGRDAAIDSMGTIASPLLAAMSVALMAVVLTSPSSFHWSNAGTLLLTGATLAFVITVQLSFQARRYAVTPADLEAWHPTPDDPVTRSILRRTQRYHKEQCERWSNRARWAYNSGILCFLGGVVAILTPVNPKHASVGRLAPALLAAAALVIEVCWMAFTAARDQRVRNWPEEPGPELDAG